MGVSMAQQKAKTAQEVEEPAPAARAVLTESMSAAPSRILDAKWDGRTSFDLPEVAEIFGVSPWTVYQDVKNGGELSKIVVSIGRRKKATRSGVERLLTKGA